MRFFAVAGAPVLHSKSPLIFRHFFQNSSIKAAYGRVAASSAAEVIFIFNSFGFDGMNITAPFKNKIIPYLTELDETALATDSVNTIVKWGDGIKGFNTDPEGAVKALEQKNIRLARQKCIVVGAGGAGAAAAFGLLKKGAEVAIVNRTYEKAQKIAASLGCRAVEPELLRNILKEADILVSAINAGNEFIKREWLRKGLIVLDANYKKPDLFHRAKSRGCRAIKGEEWLYHQAIEAYAIFTGSAAARAVIFPLDLRSELLGQLHCRREPLIMDPTESLFPGSKAGFAPSQKKADREQSAHWTKETNGESALRLDLNEARRKKLNISLVGFMGSGKTSVGQKLAEKMGLELIDSDQEIENNEGMEIEKIFKKRGEAYFRAKEKMIVNKLRKMKGKIFSCGGGAVVDSENRQILKEHSLIIFLYSTLITCLKRAEGTKRPLLIEALSGRSVEELYQLRKNLYFSTSDLLINSEKNVEEVANKIHEEISQAFGN
jgi:shikimate dehydrogenase